MTDHSFTYHDANGDPVDLNSVVHELSTTVAQFTSYGTSSTPLINTGGGVYDWNTMITKPTCEHVMGDETETEDGQVVGFCTLCGDKIRGRRMVGGYGLARLKDAIVDALGDMDAMAGLLEEIDRVELMLKVEEQALKSAHDMVNMAREMVKKIVLPERDEDAA
jgi:hypothetical protein